jgi:hypothetical protein
MAAPDAATGPGRVIRSISHQAFGGNPSEQAHAGLTVGVVADQLPGLDMVKRFRQFSHNRLLTDDRSRAFEVIGDFGF